MRRRAAQPLRGGKAPAVHLGEETILASVSSLSVQKEKAIREVWVSKKLSKP